MPADKEKRLHKPRKRHQGTGRRKRGLSAVQIEQRQASLERKKMARVDIDARIALRAEQSEARRLEKEAAKQRRQEEKEVCAAQAAATITRTGLDRVSVVRIASVEGGVGECRKGAQRGGGGSQTSRETQSVARSGEGVS